VALLAKDGAQVVKSGRTDIRGRFGFTGLAPESGIFTIRCEAPDRSSQNTADVYNLEIGHTKYAECQLGGR
jgi:hypothetical protein